jgi:hypothetical protein
MITILGRPYVMALASKYLTTLNYNLFKTERRAPPWNSKTTSNMHALGVELSSTWPL